MDYPGSKFILNVRDKGNWIRSRCKHGGGRYLEKAIASLGKSSADEVIDVWSRQWDDHLRDVEKYFEGNGQQLLVFDIERDHPSKITNFLPGIGIKEEYWEKRNASFGWATPLEAGNN